MRIPGVSFWALITALILLFLLVGSGMEKGTAVIFAVLWYLIGAGAAYAVMRFHNPVYGVEVPSGPILVGQELPHDVFTVAFTNQGKSIYVPKNGILRDAARAQGVKIHYDINQYANCFGMGHCGTCRFQPDSKAPESISAPTWQERFTLGEDVGKVRLSCQTRVLGNCTVDNAIAEEFGQVRQYALVNGALIGLFSLLMLGVIVWMGGDMIGIF